MVFSAHGVSPAVQAEARERGLKTIDATCPLVTKVHQEAKRFARDDREILLIGHAGHEEVEGTTGEAPEHITLVQSPDDVDRLEVKDPSRLAWLSQTTLSVDETLETVNRLRQRFPLLMDPPSDDICYATSNRQLAVKQIAAHSDLVIVVGSANSSNSVRLVEVALEAGAKAAHRVDNAGEIDPELAGRGRARSGSPAAPRCRSTWSRACWTTWSSAGFPVGPRGAADRGVAGLRPAAGAASRPAGRRHQRLTHRVRQNPVEPGSTGF